MDTKFWAETRAIKASIAHNLELWCAKIRQDTDTKIKKLARDIQVYKQHLALKEIKADLGELIYDGWIGSPEENDAAPFSKN